MNLAKHPITRSIKKLFATKRIINAHKLYPDDYYKHFYVSKKLCDGIELVAKFEGLSKKEALSSIIEAGLASYEWKKVEEYKHIQVTSDQTTRYKELVQLITEIKRSSQEQDEDISKSV